jgi:hypothetical protein
MIYAPRANEVCREREKLFKYFKKKICVEIKSMYLCIPFGKRDFDL